MLQRLARYALLVFPLLPATAAEVPCPDREPLRNVYFGDLHVHSALSMDAYVFGTRVTPHEAYGFARGEPLEIRPILPRCRATSCMIGSAARRAESTASW